MKIAPFPFSLNIGTDIVHIPRIHRLITPRAGTTKGTITPLDRFTRRILCDQEQEYFRSKFFRLQASKSPSFTLSDLPMPVDKQPMARWLAGRFAAKEAARKAAPGGAASISWKDAMVRVGAEADGKPDIVYIKDGGTTGEVGKLSISHDEDYVVATVLAVGSTGA